MPDRLSKYDAIFYYTGNRRVAIQASAIIFVDGPVDFDRYLAWVTPRIDSMPKLRMRLKPVPFAIRRPAWIAKPDFNVRDHILSHEVDAPGSVDCLRALVEDLLHNRLSLEKPLWRLHIINGLEEERAALLFRFHHCLADASGVLEIFGALLDSQVNRSEGLSSTSKIGISQTGDARSSLISLRSLHTREGRTRIALIWNYVRTRGPRFPFTRPVSGRVRTTWRQVPLSDLRGIAEAFETTVTDVLLAAFGSAMHEYAKKNNVSIEGENLLLEVAANVRLPNKYGKLGNEFAMLPGVIPLGMMNPSERLRCVTQYNRTLKDLGMAVMMYELMGLAFGVASPPGQALLCKTMATKSYLYLARATGLPPQEHALVSSIVVPSAGYSIGGRSVTAFVNLLMCQFNMGIAFSPVAYKDTVTLALSVDAENVGDPDSLLADLIAAIDVLHAEAVERKTHHTAN